MDFQPLVKIIVKGGGGEDAFIGREVAFKAKAPRKQTGFMDVDRKKGLFAECLTGTGKYNSGKLIGKYAGNEAYDDAPGTGGEVQGLPRGLIGTVSLGISPQWGRSPVVPSADSRRDRARRAQCTRVLAHAIRRAQLAPGHCQPTNLRSTGVREAFLSLKG